MKVSIQNLASQLWATLFSTFGVTGSDKQAYRPQLGDVVQPVFLMNPANLTFNISTFGDAFTLSNQAFSVADVQVAGGAGISSLVELFNPAASGKNVLVDAIAAFPATTAAAVDVYVTQTAIGAVGNVPQNKLAGGAAGVAVLRKGAGALPGDAKLAFAIGSGGKVFNPPFILAPGQGLMLQDTAVNEAITGAFEHREVAQ